MWTFHLIPCVHAQLLLSGPTLCDPLGSPGSVHGILQARMLERVPMPSSRGSPWSRNRTSVPCISCTAGKFFTAEPPGNPISYLIHMKYLIVKNCFQTNLETWFTIYLWPTQEHTLLLSFFPSLLKSRILWLIFKAFCDHTPLINYSTSPPPLLSKISAL